MKKKEGQKFQKAPGSFFRHVALKIYYFSFLFVFSMVFPHLSMGEVLGNTDKNVPLWWPDTQKRADAAGYGLINYPELQSLIQSQKEFILLDARPDYEYRDGHIPGAQNFEFHLGHKTLLAPERAEAFKAFLGKDRNRKIVAYCRNFR
jgi:phage shock protein E